MDNPFLTTAQLQLLRGETAAALRSARMGLSLFPEQADLWEIAAGSAAELGDDDTAASCWQRLIELAPPALDACNQLAIALERLGRDDEAEAAYRHALTLAPDDATLHCNLGLLLEHCGRLAEADAEHRLAVRLAPQCADIQANAAGLAGRLGRDREAEALYREALRLAPHCATTRSNLGVFLTDLGRDREAEAAFREALALRPDFPLARKNLAQLLLAQGRFAEGWPLHEARLIEAAASPVLAHAARSSCPPWQGQSLAGKSVLVLPEQGLGDEIQFCRYLPWLKAQGVAQLTLGCWQAQRTLMESLDGADAVVSLPDCVALLPQHDYWTVLLSLPLYAGTRAESIPAALPYLFADPARIHCQRLDIDQCLHVGIVWQGNPAHSNDADRSLAPELLAPLWTTPGLRFYSLQKPGTALPAPEIVDLAPAIADFADTAAFLAQLDLLISVDTSTAHLAGAMGLPCWLLLPAWKTDWRWQRGRDDSPWYPATRLFRQSRRGDWAGVVARLKAALDAFSAAPRPRRPHSSACVRPPRDLRGPSAPADRAPNP